MFRVLTVSLLWLSAGALAAQAPPAPWAFEDISFRHFDSRDGLRSGTVHFVARDTEGTLWAGTDEGPMVYTGRSWRPLRLPDPLLRSPARAMAVDSSGTVWIATRAGVAALPPARARGRVAPTAYDHQAGGLPDPVVYALAVTDVLDGAPTVVAATRTGVARFAGRRFERLELPPGLAGPGFTVAATGGTAGGGSLWVGSATTGLAVRDGSGWREVRRPDGTPFARVEHIAPTLSGSDGEVVVAAEDGVWLAEGGGRVRRVGGVAGAAFRVQPVVRADGREELWVGLRNGALLRRRAERWDTLYPTPQRSQAPVTALFPDRSSGGGTQVYVGLRGAGLSRLQLGPAATLDLGAFRGRWVLDMEQIAVEGREELWAATMSDGVVRVRGDGAVRYGLASGLPSDQAIDIEQWRDGGRTEVWIGTEAGPARWTGKGFERIDGGLPVAPAHDLDIGVGPDGRRTVLLGAETGLWWLDGRQWRRWPGFPASAVVAIEPVDFGDGSSFAAATRDGIWLFRQGAWSLERPFAGAAAPALRGLKFLRFGDVGGALFVVGDTAAIAWRPADARWRTVDPATHAGLDLRVVRHLEGTGQGRVTLATDGGVVVLRHAGADSVTVVDVFGEADGLPSDDTYETFEARGGGMWVSTARGVGWIPDERLGTQAATDLTMRLYSGDYVPAASGTAFPARIDFLRLNLAWRSHHRETDTEYRLDVIRDGTVWQQGAWQAEPSYTFPGLAPGEYRLRAWARDWRGVTVGPSEMAFTVLLPWWRTPWAVLALVGAAAAAAAGWHRWRTRALADRARILEENERRIAESERKFRALFDRSQDAHVLFEGDTLVAANPAAFALLQADGLEALAGRLPRDVRDVPTASGEHAVGGHGLEVALTRSDGARLVVATDANRLTVEGRSLTHVVLRDLTAQKAAEGEARALERQLREAQRLDAIGTLAGGVAHDFNNLLTVIRANVELAAEAQREGRPTGEELDAIREAGARAGALVRQILTFSRRGALQRTPVSLGQLVRDLQPMIKVLVPPSVQVEYVLPAEDAVVAGDATELQQALLNLCTNAEHAMRPTGGGRLVLGVAVEPPGRAETGGRAHVWVEDTGVGMSADVRDRVFEPFFTTKPVGEGTGLGLSVLHGIVESHGGSIEVDSTPGVGTRFDLRFPLQAADAGPAARPPEAPRATTGRGTVLLVDDDAPVLRAVRRTVERLGYAVVACASADDALRWLEGGGAVDVMLTDQTMPGMAGDALVERVRQLRPELPCVLMSGFGVALSARRLEALGHPRVLQKPMDVPELAEALEAALRRVDPVAPAP